jgi:hypothetical protein
VRKVLIVVVILVLAVGAVALFLAATTPRGSAGVRFPLTARQRELLATVPANASAFALIPAAAAFHSRVYSNPVTHAAVADWSSTHQLPRPWMLGGADLVVWHVGDRTSYAVHLDVIRAVFVRLWLFFGPSVEAESRGGTFVVNPSNAEPMGVQRLDQLLAVANGMPGGDALFVQQDQSRGAFPPIGRPSITAIKVNAEDIVLVSRSLSTEAAGHPPFRPRFAEGALLGVHLSRAPRLAGDLDRLFGARFSRLLDQGGALILYDVDTRRLLPRPDGLFVVAATPETRQAAQEIAPMVNQFGQLSEVNGMLLVGLDKESLPAWNRDTFVNASHTATDWALRADPKRLVPVLEELGDSTALRLATPRLYRSIRDLRGWIRYLSAARALEAEHSVGGGVEELRVVVVGGSR